MAGAAVRLSSALWYPKNSRFLEVSRPSRNIVQISSSLFECPLTMLSIGRKKYSLERAIEYYALNVIL